MSARGRAIKRGVVPWFGLFSWLGMVIGVLVEQAARAMGASGNSATAVGVLAAAMCGFCAVLASRVREERWPWLALAGAAFSAVPLALFLVSMILH